MLVNSMPIIEWILKERDLNKHVEISDNCQLALPNTQLRHACWKGIQALR